MIGFGSNGNHIQQGMIWAQATPGPEPESEDQDYDGMSSSLRVLNMLSRPSTFVTSTNLWQAGGPAAEPPACPLPMGERYVVV